MLLAEAHIYPHSPQIFKTYKGAAPWCCWKGVWPASGVETELISLGQSDGTNCLEQKNARSKEMFFFFPFETGIEVQEQHNGTKWIKTTIKSLLMHNASAFTIGAGITIWYLIIPASYHTVLCT